MRGLPALRDDRLLAAWNNGEDAAIWKIDEERVGILTLDFITPIVDDPRTFGEIAAANALSDVYAMGGKPFVALNIVCFPTSCEPISVLKDILDGGARKVMEAGAMLAGGHSVQDEEPKYGLAVFGEVRLDSLWTTGAARTGDSLILTKPLGTGIAATATKAGMFEEKYAREAEKNMTRLNRVPDILSDELHKSVTACTDLTGFGLAAHSLDLLGEGVSLEIETEKLPILPGVKEFADMGLLPAGMYSNKEHCGDRVVNRSEMGQFAEDIAFDPQTSGGMLLCVKESFTDEMLEALKSGGFEKSALIGKFKEGGGKVELV